MLKKYESPLWINGKESLRLQCVVSIIQVLVLNAIVFNALPLSIKGLLSLVSCIVFVRTYLRLRRTYYQIKHDVDMGWSVAINTQPFKAVVILPESIVTQHVVVLCCRDLAPVPAKKMFWCHNAMHSLLVLPDAVGQAAYQQLVVRLLTQHSERH